MAAVAMPMAVAMRMAVTMAVVVAVTVAVAVLVVVMVMAVRVAVPVVMVMVMVAAVPICMAVFVMLMLMAMCTSGPMLMTCLLGARWVSIAAAVMVVVARVAVHPLLRWLLPVAIRRRRALMTAVCVAIAVVACDPPSDCATGRSDARHRPRHAGGDLATGPAPVGG